MQPKGALASSRFTGSPSRLRDSAVRVERVGVHNQLWLETSVEARLVYKAFRSGKREEARTETRARPCRLNIGEPADFRAVYG